VLQLQLLETSQQEESTLSSKSRLELCFRRETKEDCEKIFVHPTSLMKLKGLGVLQISIRLVVQTLDLNGLETNYKGSYAKGYDDPVEKQ
jgi:hypothetical protein